MAILADVLKNKKTVVILGHVNPDGDCIGSCLAMYNYLLEQYAGISVTVYLEIMPNKFDYLKGYEKILHECNADAVFDLCITLDASDVPRLGRFSCCLEHAKDSLCIDHHITNTGLAKTNVINAAASSTCEVLFRLLDEDKISHAVAECLYTGIIHDTGVFKFSSTSRKTMDAAGCLMEKGVDFPKIIDDSFYRKTYGQNLVLGRALLKSVMSMDGKLIYSVITRAEMKECGVASKELDGIIDQLRITEDVDCAMFLYETGNPAEYKVSLRSNSELDVSRIAGGFGGGGHVKAAGCTMAGDLLEVIGQLTDAINEQLQEFQLPGSGSKLCTTE